MTCMSHASPTWVLMQAWVAAGAVVGPFAAMLVVSIDCLPTVGSVFLQHMR